MEAPRRAAHASRTNRGKTRANFLCVAMSRRAVAVDSAARDPASSAVSESASASIDRHASRARARFRAPACALVLFAARGRADHCAAGGACQERPPAGPGAHRYRQHVRRARILREDGERRHPADHRLRARRRLRRPGKSRHGDGRGSAAARAPCRARGRLSQPDAAIVARIPRYRSKPNGRISSSPG